MPLRITATPVSVERRRSTRKAFEAPLTIALVNNMPDAALLATERQFTSLVRGAAGRRPLRLAIFSSAKIARSGEAARHAATTHAPLETLFANRFDAVIVTGNEPRESRLDKEPYWDDLRRLVDWAQTHARVSIWSCLAAHAALLHLDGVERVALPEKLSGVYEAAVAADDPLLAGLGSRLWTPHSRYNTLRESDLVAHGYKILARSNHAGVDMFSRDGDGLFLFLQGHPEYDSDTLLREYRRDVGRFLRGESDVYPREPAGYFNGEAISILNAFRRRATTHRHAELFDVFPNVAVPFAITNRWHDWAVRFYRNWLAAAPREHWIGA
jgi:homoserine O-succinyltransferase